MIIISLIQLFLIMFGLILEFAMDLGTHVFPGFLGNSADASRCDIMGEGKGFVRIGGGLFPMGMYGTF